MPDVELSKISDKLDDIERLNEWKNTLSDRNYVSSIELSKRKDGIDIAVTKPSLSGVVSSPKVDTLTLPPASENVAGLMTPDQFGELNRLKGANVFPACPLAVANGNLLFVKPGLTGHDVVRSSQLDGLGAKINGTVFDIDGTSNELRDGTGVSLVFRDTVITRRDSQVSGADRYDWDFECGMKMDNRWYTVAVTLITQRTVTEMGSDQGYECNQLRIRKIAEDVAGQIADTDTCIQRRYEQTGIVGFGSIIPSFPGRFHDRAEEGDGIVPEGTVCEVAFDRLESRFIFIKHTGRTEFQDVAYGDWSALDSMSYRYDDYYDAEGRIRTDRLYRCGAGLYRFADGNLQELDAKEALFIDMWDVKTGSSGGYDLEGAPDKSKPYKLNDLYFSYDEALKIHAVDTAVRGLDFRFIEDKTLCKTFLPFTFHWANTYNLSYGFYQISNAVEKIALTGASSGIRVSNLSYAFYGNVALTDIIGVLDVSACTNFSYAFSNCTNLRNVRLSKLKSNLTVTSSRLSHDTLRFLVDNAANTSPITVTVHADIYKTLTGESTSDLNGGTAAEWQKLLADAVARNISFATN